MFSLIPAKPGPQRANSADQQLDLHAGLRCAVEQANHFRIHQRISFENEMALAAFLLMFDLPVDHGFPSRAQIHRRDEQSLIVGFG